jgi:ribulose-phosphate 3-epimerase
MNVLPVINCPDRECAVRKIAILREFLPHGEFVHMDVTDGIWSAHRTWNDPLGWARVGGAFALEAHLMVERPEDVADDWFSAGARRLAVHAETIDGAALYRLLHLAERHKGEIMLATAPGDDFEAHIMPFIERFGERLTAFQVLAVHPGASGQHFDGKEAIARITFLRQAAPHATIEVDGGMNPETARLVKAAGADTVVSSSYLFNNGDPRRAYEAFVTI